MVGKEADHALSNVSLRPHLIGGLIKSTLPFVGIVFERKLKQLGLASCSATLRQVKKNTVSSLMKFSGKKRGEHDLSHTRSHPAAFPVVDTSPLCFF